MGTEFELVDRVPLDQLLIMNSGGKCPILADVRERFLHRNKKGKVTEVDYFKLSIYIIDALHIHTTDSGVMYSYRDGIYIMDKGLAVSTLCTSILGNIATNRICAEVVGQVLRNGDIRINEYITERTPDNLICFNNGVLDIDTMVFSNHSPDNHFVAKLAVDYNPDAACPNIARVAKDIFGEMVTDEYEWIGFCMSKGNWLNVISFYLGEGANGKSTWFNMVRKLFGAKQCCSMTPHALSDGPHAMEPLEGRILNIDADIGKAPIKNMETLKKLSGNDAVSINPKGMPIHDAILDVKQMYGCNDLPIITDNSFSVSRRLRIVYCNAEFTAGNQNFDANVADRIESPTELSGLVNIAISALRDLRARGKFISMNRLASKKYDDISKAMDRFMETCIDITGCSSDLLYIDDIYELYDTWRDVVGLPGKKEQTVKADFRARVYAKSRIEPKRRQRVGERRGVVYVGIKQTTTTSELRDDARLLRVEDCLNWLSDNHVSLCRQNGHNKGLRTMATHRFGPDVVDESWDMFMESVAQ
jgi:putative DNA primase/helicase